jgi:DNA-directed RNA polymerase subunit RPC12/RpoP
MVIRVLKCQMCGTQFEAKVLDRDDPDERQSQGTPVRCPKCGSAQIEIVRTVRRAG